MDKRTLESSTTLKAGPNTIKFDLTERKWTNGSTWRIDAKLINPKGFTIAKCFLGSKFVTNYMGENFASLWISKRIDEFKHSRATAIAAGMIDVE